MFQFNPKGTITMARGFKVAGVHCGIKKRKKDIALTYSDIPGDAAGTFTSNKVSDAPNDTVIILANGLSRIKRMDGADNYVVFLEGLIAISSEMAKAIVSGGEGAAKLINVTVNADGQGTDGMIPKLKSFKI